MVGIAKSHAKALDDLYEVTLVYVQKCYASGQARKKSGKLMIVYIYAWICSPKYKMYQCMICRKEGPANTSHKYIVKHGNIVPYIENFSRRGNFGENDV